MAKLKESAIGMLTGKIGQAGGANGMGFQSLWFRKSLFPVRLIIHNQFDCAILVCLQ